MNITRSTINGIVSSQINSTMQSHMRDYSNLSPIYSKKMEEEAREREEKRRRETAYKMNQFYLQFTSYFENIIYYLFDQITHEELEIRNEPLIEDAKNFLRRENEKIISSAEFTEAIEKKQQLKEKINDLSFSTSREYKGYSIYYIPSIDNESTDIIRMDIIESFYPYSSDVEEQTINGSIDFYEDGTINVGTFTEYEERIQRDDEGKLITDRYGLLISKSFCKKVHEITLDETGIKKENLVEVGNIISDLLNSLNESIDKKR